MKKEKVDEKKGVEKEIEMEARTKIVEKPKKDRKLTIVIGVFLFIIIILLGILLFPYVETFAKETFPTLPFWSEEAEDEMEEEAAEENELDLEETITDLLDDMLPTYSTYTGDVITAELPEGWEIEEYFDGDGTDMVVEGTTYTGLTGLKIFNEADENVFTMMAVSGIGFAGCGDYAIFDDDNEAYYQEQVDANDVVGDTMTEHDYTNTEYSEFDWMGTTMRRIDDLYYYDTEEGNNYFEPPCVPGLIVLEGFSFEDGDGYLYEAYFYGLEDITEESEYEVVDSILESMEAV